MKSKGNKVEYVCALILGIFLIQRSISELYPYIMLAAKGRIPELIAHFEGSYADALVNETGTILFIMLGIVESVVACVLGVHLIFSYKAKRWKSVFIWSIVCMVISAGDYVLCYVVMHTKSMLYLASCIGCPFISAVYAWRMRIVDRGR